MKTYDGNDLKLGTVVPVVLDTVLKPADFKFKRSRLRVRVRIVASGSEVIPECGRCQNILLCKNNLTSMPVGIFMECPSFLFYHVTSLDL